LTKTATALRDGRCEKPKEVRPLHATVWQVHPIWRVICRTFQTQPTKLRATSTAV